MADIIVLDAKHKIKRSTVASVVPTLGPSADHTDGTWSDTDIYPGEFFWNESDEILWNATNSGIVQIFPAPASDTSLATNDQAIDSTGLRKILIGGPAAADRLEVRDDSDTETIFIFRGDTRCETKQLTVGNVGNAVQYSHNVYSRLASSSGLSKHFNNVNALIIDTRQAAGSPTVNYQDASGVSQVFINGSAGTVETKSKFIVNGNAGLTVVSTYGGGGAGEVATHTFTGGILTGETLVT